MYDKVLCVCVCVYQNAACERDVWRKELCGQGQMVEDARVKDAVCERDSCVRVCVCVCIYIYIGDVF